MRQLADHALESTQGLTVEFLVSDCGSLDACAARARGLQSSFSSMRARNRAKVASHMFDAGVDAHSKYDALVCQRQPMANGQGWAVVFRLGYGLDVGWRIIDNATGEPLKNDAEFDRMTAEFTANPRKFWDDPERMAWAERLSPGFRKSALLHTPGLARAEEVQVTEPTGRVNDPNNIPMDVDPFADPT